MEGMFLINTNPLYMHKTLEDYAKFLQTRFILTQFRKGASEVHVIFDNPGRLDNNTPKATEQKHRDNAVKILPDHTCKQITKNTQLPHKQWRENYINCRTCKRELVKFLGNYFLATTSQYLTSGTTLYVAGIFDGDVADTAWFVDNTNHPQPDPTFKCRAEETDTRVWLHAKRTKQNNILILSPDTDVYTISLPLVSVFMKDIKVQVSTYHARELKFLV